MQVAKRLDGIGEYYFSQKLREIDGLNKAGKRVINLGIGNPDLPPHPSVVAALAAAAENPAVHGYQGYKGIPELREAMAAWYHKWYGVSLQPDQEILPLIGSKEGIMHVCMTYLSEGDEALVPNPGYPTYTSAVHLAGGTCVSYELTEASGWMPDFRALEKRDLSKVKLMWVNYPHMPTGQLPSDNLFQGLVAFGKKHGILICHDNPYSFILNNAPKSILSVSGAKDTAIELNSLSKSHNMAGWRVGMLCGSKERLEEILRFKSNMDSGMFLPVQRAAGVALSLDGNWHEDMNTIYGRRRKKVFELLDLLGCTYSREQAGLFVWARVTGGLSGYDLSDKVLSGANVFITPGGIFGSAGLDYVRVSLCSTEERLTEAMERISKMNA